METGNTRANPPIVHKQPGWGSPAKRVAETEEHVLRGRGRGNSTHVLLNLEKSRKYSMELTSIEPSVAPFPHPSYEAFPRQTSRSRDSTQQRSGIDPMVALNTFTKRLACAISQAEKAEEFHRLFPGAGLWFRSKCRWQEQPPPLPK